MPPQAQALAMALLFVVSVGLLYRFFAWLGRRSRSRAQETTGDVFASGPRTPPEKAASQPEPPSPVFAASPTPAAASTPAQTHVAPPRTSLAPSIAATLNPQPPAPAALRPNIAATIGPASPLLTPSVAATLPPAPTPQSPPPPAARASPEIKPAIADPIATTDATPKKSTKPPRSTTSTRPKIAGASARAANRRPIRDAKEESASRLLTRATPTLPVLRARADKSRLKVIGHGVRSGRGRRAHGLKQRLADRTIRIVGTERARRIDAAKAVSTCASAA